MLSFDLFDAVNPNVKRVTVRLNSPRRSDIPAGAILLYACDLKLGPEEVPTREVIGLSPIECLAAALGSIDSWLRFEHNRAPLVWDDGREYGGDYDIPIVQVIEQINNETKAVYDKEATKRGIEAKWPDS